MADVSSGESSDSSEWSDDYDLVPSSSDHSFGSSSPPLAMGDPSSDSDTPLRRSSTSQRPSTSQAGSSAPAAAAPAPFAWTAEDSTPLKYGFTGKGGMMDPRLVPGTTCSEAFLAFFDELIDQIVVETNRYAAQNPPPKSSHMRAWSDVTTVEMQVFLALCIMTGITKHPTLHSYWSTDPLLKAGLFPSIMPRDRFLAILHCLHFNNTAEMPEDCPDRLYKLRPVIDHLLERFATVYTPERDIAVDDSLYNFFGHLRLRTYKRRKRARFGIKAYKLCQSTGDAAGYCYTFKIYTSQDKGELPTTAAVVLDLVRNLNGQGYTLALDRAFSSPDLFQKLHSKKFNVVGTVLPNRRHMPMELRSIKLKQGETAHWSAPMGPNSSLLTLVWQDKNVRNTDHVCMLSTMHTAEIRGSGKRDRTGEEKRKPACVLEYNAIMGGVDKSDQRAAIHRSARKSLRWYKKLFFCLMDLTLVNAHCVYLALGRHLSFQDFRLELVRELLFENENPLPEYRPQRATSSAVPSRLVGRHFPIALERTGSGDYRYRRCIVCSAKGRRKKTHIECDTCHQPLCIVPCFRDYHTVH